MDETFSQKPISLISKKAWFLIFRSITAVILLVSGAYFLKPLAFNVTLLSLYSAFTLIFIIYNITSKHYSEEYIGSIVIIQLAGELLIEGLLVNQVGGNFSPFIIFFILTIISSAPFFHLAGATAAATIAGLLYASPIFFNLSPIYDGIIEPSGLAGMGISSDEAFYTVFLHLCLFYFFAFISGYFAEKLFVTSRELTSVKLETEEILEQMRSGLLTVNADGRIVYFNQTAGQILGVDPTAARGRKIKEVLHIGLAELRRYIETGLKTGRTETRSEIEITHFEKGGIPIGLSSSIIRDEKRNIRGVITLFQDLTEAKKLNERIQAADRMAAVGRMAAGIAHEIRNPLASISGSVEILKNELQLVDDNQKLLQLIIKESSRLNTILSDFLNFARINKTSSGACDLPAVIRDVVKLAEGHEQIRGRIKITFETHRSLIMVSGAEDQIKQVLWNLILNSAQAMEKDGGDIMITTKACPIRDSLEMVKLCIADDGPGMSDDTKSRIFDPFFSTKDDGTGLGLPIVARIVDCLGGRIEVESSLKGGTVFTIFLPAQVSSGPDLKAPKMVVSSQSS